MITVPVGAFGFDPSGTAVTINTTDAGNFIRVKTGPWLNIFRRVGLEQGDITKNELGLYTKLDVDGEGKAKFLSINPAHHLFRPRQNGCVWNPNGRIRTGLTEVDTCPIEYQGEECPDAYWNSCMEALFAPGNGVRDLKSSPELMAILAATLATTATGLGNSFHELVHFGLHPLITDADTNDTFAVDEERWEDFYNQMIGTTARPNNCSGLVTLMDALADQGEPGYDIDIPDADIDADNNYIGDIVALFETIIGRAKSELRIMARRGVGTGSNKKYPILLVTSPEFRAYKDYLTANFAYSPSLLTYVLTGSDGLGRMMPGVLDYYGIPVVEWDESSTFDEIVGTKTHRVALVAPGTFGVASDVRNIKDAYNPGTGLQVLQRLDMPYMGKIYMSTTLRWGTVLADKDFIVYARNLTPNV
jgi:hypothetical protein